MKNSFQHYANYIYLINARQKFEHEQVFRQHKRERKNKNECGNPYTFIVDWQIDEGTEKLKAEYL